jgi:hypothetical protein
MWDKINIAYRKRGQDLMYGIASDDSHHYHLFGKTYSNAGRGWVMVETDKLTPDALITAMERGDFYASTGVELEVLKIDKSQVFIRVKTSPGVSYSIEFIRANEKGEISSEVVNASEAKMSLEAKDLFLRAKITSSKVMKNPVNDVEYESAWTQPMVYKKAR